MRPLILVLLAACSGGTPTDDDDVDTLPTGTDTDAVDTDPGVDTPVDTDTVVDTDPDTDSVVDTDPLPEPPASFGAGFVRVDQIMTTMGLRTNVGTRTDPDDGPGDAGGVIVDLDGNGVMDVMLLGLKRPGSTTPQDERGTAVLKWNASTRTLDASTFSLADASNDLRLFGALDIDGDGRDDVLGVGALQPVRFAGVPAADNPSLDAPLETIEFARRVVPGDVDADGLLDLLLFSGCNDLTSPLLVAYQEGPRRWHVETGALPPPVGVSPYTLLFAPLAGEDPVLHLIGDPCYNGAEPQAFFRASGRDPVGRPRFEPYDPTPSTSTYKFSTVAAGGPINYANPMGETYADLDADGRFELFIATSRDRLDVFEEQGTSLVERTLTYNLLHPVNAGITPGRAEWGEFHLPWAMSTLDLDLDGWPDLLVEYGDDYGTWVDQLTPGMAMRAWWNAGGRGFVAVEDRVGLAAPQGGHAIAIGDLDDDGRPDLVQGGGGRLPRVFHNRIDTGHHGIGVRLRGTTSNAEGFGAVVQVMVEGLPTQTLLAGHSASLVVVQKPLVFAGLGTSEVADTVRVTWPSGVVQEVHDLPADHTHTITEPQVVQVLPASRRAPADGASTLTLRVQPVDIAGAPRSGTVTVRRLAGSDVVIDAPVADGLAWTVTAHAPRASGSTQLEVAIDGTPMKVKPRLFWAD